MESKQPERQMETTIVQRTIRSAAPYFSAEDRRIILDDIEKTLQSGELILGPRVKELEKSFANYMGVKYALATSSCTAALEIAMRFFDVENREVVVPTNTFIATPNSVRFAGGEPVFADIAPKTYNTTSQNLLSRLTARTKGFIGVHLGGLPITDIEAIAEVCKQKGIFLIEDCSHAHGASIHGRKVGSIGDAGCFSLMATKIMTSGLGGMLVTNNERLYEYAATVRDSASGRSSAINFLASDWMMSEITAAVGLQQLKRLNDFLEIRKRIAERYMQGLAEFGNLAFHRPSQEVYHAHYKFLAALHAGVSKAELITKAKEHRIEIGSLYAIPCHMQPVYQKLGHAAGECPVAEETLQHQIALPVHAQMTEEDADAVVSFLRREIE